MKYTIIVALLVLSSLSFSQTKDDCREQIVALWNNTNFDVAKLRVIDYCFNNPNCDESILSIYRLRQEISKDSILVFLNKLNNDFENNKTVKSLYFYYKNSQLLKDNQYYDFTFISNESKKGQLSEILAEKDLLIIFDGLSCMQEVGRQMWKNFYKNIDHDKMEIISFLFVNNIEELQMQKETFEIPWLVVSDLNSIHSPVKLIYDVQGTPKFCIINKNGQIKYNEIDFSEEVSTFVRNHLIEK